MINIHSVIPVIDKIIDDTPFLKRLISINTIFIFSNLYINFLEFSSEKSSCQEAQLDVESRLFSVFIIKYEPL